MLCLTRFASQTSVFAAGDTGHAEGKLYSVNVPLQVGASIGCVCPAQAGAATYLQCSCRG